MKHKCKKLTFSLYEFSVQWKDFIMTFIILSLLFAAVISILHLARKIPDEMNEYMVTNYQGVISLQTNPENLEAIESAPVHVVWYDYPMLTEQSIGIQDRFLINEEENIAYDLRGRVLRWTEHWTYAPADMINQRLIAGNGVSENCNEISAIWISDQVATYLGKQIDDSIQIKLDFTTAKTVTCPIAGIYHQEDILNGFYITAPLYYQSMSDIQDLTVHVIPKDLSKFEIVKNELSPLCTLVYGNYGFASSVVTMIDMLYAVACCMITFTILILISAISHYIKKRIEFFALCKSMGMSSAELFGIIRYILLFVITLSFLCGMLIAPSICQYIADIIEKQFNGTNIDAHIWNLFNLILYGAITLILQLSCSFQKRKINAIQISNMLRQGDE